jgi:hypothetical protein
MSRRPHWRSPAATRIWRARAAPARDQGARRVRAAGSDTRALQRRFPKLPSEYEADLVAASRWVKER